MMTSLYYQLLKRERAQRAAEKAKKRLTHLRAQQGKEPTPEPEPEATGLDDLPDEIALTLAAPPIQAPPAQPESKTEPLPPDSVENLVRRMSAIRERIWRLRAVFATTLSQEVAISADRYLKLFQDLAAQLRIKAPEELDKLVRGHESLLQSPSVVVKPTIPLKTQQWCELRAEVLRSGAQPQPPPNPIPDGLGQFL